MTGCGGILQYGLPPPDGLTRKPNGAMGPKGIQTRTRRSGLGARRKEGDRAVPR